MSTRRPLILVVDDERDNCDLFTEILESMGNYRVECAYNGQQALEMATSRSYDLIVSDITMPQLDGLSFLKEVKRKNPSVEVIMISGAGSIDAAVEAFKSQAFDFLSKPLEIDKLLSTVKAALNKAGLTGLVADLASTLPYQDTADADMLLGHLVVDSGGRVFSVAKRLLDALGIQGDPAGKPLASIPALSFLNAPVQASLAQKVDNLRHWAVLGLRDRLRMLAFSARFMEEVAQGTPGVLLVISDVTRIRRQEKEKRDRERLSAIGQMASVVSMQVNGVTSNVVGHCERMLTDVRTLNDRRPNFNAIITSSEQACDAIRKSMEKVGSLLGTLQEFTRQFTPQFGEVDVNDLVQSAASQITDPPDTIGMELDMSDEVKSVQGNAKDLVQAFVHVMQNAIEAMNGKGTLTIRSRQVSPELVALQVCDDGEGIPIENLERIYEPFFTTKGDKHKGLGLPLARKVIEDHDGVLNVVSQPGRGATFTITLPSKV